MARPKRCRRICQYPDFWRFGPENTETNDSEQSLPSTMEPIILALDEYETIRLIDYQKLNQEQCAKQMDIARTTVTAIYDTARFKLADALINGKRIIIGGGNYRLQSESTMIPDGLNDKGGTIMRIAVTYENGEIFQHFGHTQQFMVYDVEDNAIVKQELVDTAGSGGHGALAGLLFNTKVDALICGGIGGGARMALAEAGIELYPGVSGSAEVAVQALVEGTLDYDPNTECHHHGHGHGEGHGCEHSEGHGCGHGEGHGCGHGGQCHS